MVLLRWLFTCLVALWSIVAHTQRWLSPAPPPPAPRRRHRRRSRSASRDSGAASSGGEEEADEAPAQLPRPDPRLQMLSGAIVCAIQLSAYWRYTEIWERARTPLGVFNMASVVALEVVALIALPAAAPRWWERRFLAINAATRITFFALPALRDPMDVEWMLQVKPFPRLYGPLLDWHNVALGARGTALLMSSLVCPVHGSVPLLANLLLGAYSVQCVRTTARMCRTPLLTAPAFRRRFARIHQAIGALPLLAPDATAAVSAAGSPEERCQLQCRIFMAAFQLVMGVVAPLLLIAKAQAPVVAARAARTLSGQLSSRRLSGGSSRGRSGSLQLRASGPLERAGSRCLGWLRQAAEEGEAALLHLCRILLNAVGSPLLTFLTWWVMASLVWVTAMVLEQPHLALAGAAPPAGPA